MNASSRLLSDTNLHDPNVNMVLVSSWNRCISTISFSKQFSNSPVLYFTNFIPKLTSQNFSNFAKQIEKRDNEQMENVLHEYKWCLIYIWSIKYIQTNNAQLYFNTILHFILFLFYSNREHMILDSVPVMLANLDTWKPNWLVTVSYPPKYLRQKDCISCIYRRKIKK